MSNSGRLVLPALSAGGTFPQPQTSPCSTHLHAGEGPRSFPQVELPPQTSVPPSFPSPVLSCLTPPTPVPRQM